MAEIMQHVKKYYPQYFDGKNFLDLQGSPPMMNVTSGLISVGKVSVPEAVASMSGNELAALINKMDRIWGTNAPHVARMVSEGVESAVALVQIISQVAQSGAQFTGILATGQALDIWPIRPKDVGGVFLNGAGALALGGLYGGASGLVYTWRHGGLVGGTQVHLVPQQTTSGVSPFGGLVIFGGIEKTYTPKIESVIVNLQGQTVNAQPCNMTEKRTFGDDNDISAFMFEKPIMVLNGESWGVDLMPNENGTTNFELVGMMVGQVQSKVN